MLTPLLALLPLLASLAGAPVDAPAAKVLPFVADDYPGALGEARGRGVPLFVEAWPPGDTPAAR